MNLIIWTALLFVLLNQTYSTGESSGNELLVPQFEHVPVPVTYYDAQSTQPIPLACRAWPLQPLSSVSYYTASRMSGPGGNRVAPAVHQVLLYPVRESLLMNESAGLTMLLSKPGDLAWLNEQEIHCVASTPFGSILSAPFRLLRAGMDDNLTTNHNPSGLVALSSANTSVMRVHKNNVAIVRCHLPKSRPAAEVQFKRDGSLLTHALGKHLLVHSLSGDYVDLLISAFGPNDQGVYQCVATNPVTGKMWTDPQSYRLELKRPPKTNWTRLIRGFAQRLELIVKEGDNLTLYCHFEAWPFRSSTVERVNRVPLDHERYRFDPRFGSLHLTQVRVDDEGWYRCAVQNVTSTVFVRVKRQPRVSLSPAFVSVPSGTAVTLNCSSSGPSVPLWYFNGRIKLSQRSTGFDSQLFLPAVDASTTGVYQCVVRDSDNNWISAQSVVSLNLQRPIQRVDYNQLMQHMGPAKEWHTTVSRGLSNQLISLNCLPPEPHLTELSRWLSDSLPGRGSIASRLQLAYQLGFVLVYWRKDGVQLKLPTPSPGPVELLQLNLTVARSVDFGSYRCELWTAVRHVLFSHETRLSPADENNAPALRPAMPSHGTKLNPPNRSPHVMHPETSSSTSSKSNGTELLVPTDRDKRNVLANAGQSTRLDLMLPATGSQHGVLAYADQVSGQPDSNIRAPNLDSHRPMVVTPTLRIQRPNASTVGDNLAAWISWPAMKVDFYQVLFRTRLPMDTSWSKPFYAEERIVECCGQQPSCCDEIRQIYLTNRQHDRLEPGHLYEFRIRAFIGEALAGKSPWSRTVSFEHISKVAPVITETVRLPDGGMLARWTLATSAVGFPIDHFLLLYRPETRFANGKTTYDGFQAVFLPSGDTWECTLHNLEPGKGYQIVVYGVHTPPGLDPQMSIFKGGIGGRRITQFSPEIFVKVKDTSSESGVDAARGASHSQNSDSSGTGRETGVAFNSAESNRLMFLILGALAGFMILIMICLVILCVWRQQREKQRLLLYCNSTDGTGTKSADGFMEQPQQSRPLPGSGTFLLNHLNTLENEKSMIAGPRQSRQISQRSSLIYPQPPPMSPPPPPPPSALANQLACAHQDDTMEMASLMSDYAQQHQQNHMLNPIAQRYPTAAPPPPPPPAPTLTAQIAVEPHQVYWAAQYPQIPMAGSKYSGQFIPINYYPSNSTMANVPHGLKREPPSGGSVHDGTDTECDVMDQVLALGRNEHFIQPRNPLSPGPTDAHGIPYQSVSPASFALGSAVNGTYHPQPMVYDPGTQLQQQQQQQYNPVHCHRMQSVDADPNRNYSHMYPSYSLSMTPSNPGQPLAVTGPYNPGLEPNPVPNCAPSHSFDPRVLPAQMSGSLSRAPDPDNTRQDKLNGSIQSENRHHYHHHRRRRRRLTADSGTSDNPERDEYRHTGTTDTGTPLMTSSPVTQEQSRADVPQLEVNSGDQPPPLPQHHPSHGGTAYSHGGRYVQENYAQNIAGNHPINGGGIAGWNRAYSSPGWPDQVRVFKMGHNVPPEVPAHRPYHIPGPLTYGNHNPSAGTATPSATTAPNSLTRRIPVGLLNGPPRVRDYSEYGIPNVHANMMQPPARQENGVHGSMDSVDDRNGDPYAGTRPGVVSTTSDRRFAPLGQTTT